LRELLPAQNAIVGVDLADVKRAAVATDHDSRPGRLLPGPDSVPPALPTRPGKAVSEIGETERCGPPARASRGLAAVRGECEDLGWQVSIRTPDQRLRVFVSSTLQELAADRQAVREAIESLRMTPVMFELGARPHPPRALYRAYLEQSDVFIGLYWESYGWVAPGEEVSGLEDEYGLSGDRPKLIYIKTPAPNRQPQLSTLIARIQRDDRISYRPYSDPDELHSLVADDLAVLLTETFSASAAPQAEPSRPEPLSPLPRAPTRLIGRDGDVARVLELLADPDTRMVTLFGTGGIGKSRLALAVAERAKSRYADGVAYIELAPVTEPSLVLPTIAEAIGVQAGAGVSIGPRLRDRLADARMLIVLDNMEQLTEAADQLSDLLASTDALQLLVTSRRILNIRGEQVFPLEPLAVPADGAITSAVELFLDRARAIRPEYQPSDQDLAAFGELSRRLDGLPLAIELAAARVRILTPRAVLERMGRQPLEFLRTTARDLPPRQRTLRDTIAWSHSLLPPDAQLLFARLGVFVGSADLEAIEQVTNPADGLNTLDLLADLVDESLVRTVGEAAEPRFGMLETIREFAVERLEASGEAADYRARHQAHYLALAERGNAALGTAQQVDWLDRFSRENDNFRAVLRRAIRRDDAAAAVRMGRALANYWYMASSHSEARGWMQQTAALPSAGPHERAVAWTIGAIEAFLQGDFEPLETGLDDVPRLASEAEDRRTVAFAQLLQAVASGAASDDERWQEALTEASRRLEAEGEPLAVGFSLVAGSVLARVHGRADEAQRLAQAAHDLSTRIGESYVRMYASTQLARTALESADVAGAQRYAVEALLSAQRLRNLNAMSYALELWATAELRAGRLERAGQLFALAERGYRQVGSRPWRTDAELHRRLDTELQAALGDRYGQFLAEARNLDFDEAIAQLIRSQPAAH
jgi:predicted ATPase